MKRAIVSVTNDLTTDQRVDRTCMTLIKAGYDVLLVGRQRRDSKALTPRSYRMHQMQFLFDKGPWFYAEYNIRLFFFLLFQRFSLLVSNDLDTLPATYLACLCSRIQPGIHRHIHDCHEYFRGMPELNGRKSVTAVWKFIEDTIFPGLKTVLAVNQSVADIYSKEYGNKITVIRNVPFRKTQAVARNKSEFNIGPDLKVILYQGAINIDRGLEEMILAMEYLRTDAVLLIAGTGDIYDRLRGFSVLQGLTEKVRFLGQIPFQELHTITLMADLGLSIEKDVSVNYHYCLPNKLLDYIQAQVPVLVSPFPEMKTIVDMYQIGEYIERHDPEYLAEKIDTMLNNPDKMALYRQNLQQAASDLCWENEEKKIFNILS